MLLFALGLIVLIGLGAVAVPQARKAREYINRVSQCGYLCPPPGRRAVAFLNLVARFMTWFQVGRLKIVGQENLKVSGPVIFAPNHDWHADPALVILAVDRTVRFLAAQRFFRFGWGLTTLLCGPCGAISTDLRPGKGGPAKDAAIKVLTTGQTLAMFPEGYTWLDGAGGPYKKGCVRIAREAARQLGSPVSIIPMSIRYNRYPGAWIRKWDPQNGYFFLMLMFWYYRRGATITIGKAISSADLPADDAQATDLLRDRIVSMHSAGH